MGHHPETRISAHFYLAWMKNNFFDMSLYAGEGNIGHMIEQVNYVKDRLFSDEDSLV
jgi:8-oxo-dGTP diphosphatase